MTKTNKHFEFAGFATFADVRKVRFANDETRATHLEKLGATAVEFHPLPNEMNKVDAVRWMVDNVALSTFDLELAQAWLEKNTRVPGPRGRPRKAPVEQAEAVETAEPAQEEEQVVVGEFTDLDNMTPKQKLARKRFLDAKRKREKRAALKAANPA